MSDHYLEVFDPFFFAEAGRLMALSAFALAGLLALAGAIAGQHFWKDPAFTVALCVIAINGTALWHMDSFPDNGAMLRILGRITLYRAAVWLSVCTGIFINRADSMLSSPGYLAWAFLTALFSIPTGLFVFISKIRFIIMQILPYGALPSAIAAVEILIPGRIGCAIAQVISHLFLSIKKIDLQIKMKSSPASLVVMFICIGAAVAVWRQILGEGYDFSASSVTGIAALVAKLVFIPILLIFLTVRSRAFSRLEGRLAALFEPDGLTPSTVHSDIQEA